MPTIQEHEQAAAEALAARDAATNDADKVRFDISWSHHVTAARLVRIAEKHELAVGESRRTAAMHNGRGELFLAAAHRELAEKSAAAARFCVERAEARSEAGHAMMRAPAPDDELRSIRDQEE
jgi:hypothetical protein